MSKRKVILELTATSKRARSFAEMETSDSPSLDTTVVPKLGSVEIDKDFPVTALPQLKAVPRKLEDHFDTGAALDFDMRLDSSTYLVRGEVDEKNIAAFENEVAQSKEVVGFFADVVIAPMRVCPGSPAVGDAATVENLLCTWRMRSCGMNGSGVLVAIVDSGINLSHLKSKGKTPTFDSTRSWVWDPAIVTPGSAPVGHGTMCAFDVCIAAPQCTLLDIALLRPISSPPGGVLIEGLLSDAIRAYRHLLDVMTAPQRPGENRSLVVNNSWGMFHPSWDWPLGHLANYSDNPNHPFNRIVVTLERAGADILFAAGNCGQDCPDGRCGDPPVTAMAIYGANSSPAVTCVAGVDTTKVRAGYSSIGPGRLENRKPDISGYTHFSGSGVYAADGGTSAATPVVAGVVAATRSKRPFSASDPQTRPSAIRNLICSTAEDLGASGYDYEHGHGVVDGCALIERLCPINPPINLCERFPWLCDPDGFDICRRYPWICQPLPVPPRPPIPPISPDPVRASSLLRGDINSFEQISGMHKELAEMPDAEAAFLIGYLRGQQGSALRPSTLLSVNNKKDCDCE